MGTGLPVHMTAMFQGQYTAACAYLLHTCHISVLSRGGLGMLVYLSAMSQHHVVAWAHLLVSLLCYRTVFWSLEHSCLHTCCVPGLPFGGLGMPVCIPAMSQHHTERAHLFTHKPCPSTAMGQRGLAVCMPGVSHHHFTAALLCLTVCFLFPTAT